MCEPNDPQYLKYRVDAQPETTYRALRRAVVARNRFADLDDAHMTVYFSTPMTLFTYGEKIVMRVREEDDHSLVEMWGKGMWMRTVGTSARLHKVMTIYADAIDAQIKPLNQ